MSECMLVVQTKNRRHLTYVYYAFAPYVPPFLASFKLDHWDNHPPSCYDKSYDNLVISVRSTNTQRNRPREVLPVEDAQIVTHLQ